MKEIMKKRLFATSWLMLLASVFAITSMAQAVTVQVNTAGELWDELEAQGVTDFSSVKDLTVTGNLGDEDFKFIKNQLSDLEKIDISGTNIKEVPDQAFSNKKNLKTVRLPQGITRINYDAFNNCQKLESVTFGSQTAVAGKITFPSSLGYVGSSAFYNCQQLTHLDFSACSVLESLDNDSFKNLINLEEVLLPSEGKLRLEWNCFNVDNFWDETTEQWVYKGLESMTLTKAVTYLSGYSLPRTLKTLYVESATPPSCYDDTFNNFSESNVTIYIPKGALRKYRQADGWTKVYKSMQELGFQVNISGYGSLQKGSATYTDGDVFFANQSSATTLKLVPDQDNEWISVKLDGGALTVATNGTFTIPTGTTIGTLDVSFTSKMLTVNNPNGGQLKDLIAAPGTIRGLKVVGKMAAKDWTFVKNNMTALEEFDISETDLTAIPEEALHGHQKLTFIHLPSTVTNIGNSAFYNCPQLTTVDGCENVKEIGSSAFNSCKKMSNFPFGNAIQIIESSAFYSCSSLPATLVMPASLATLGWSSVFNESSITSFDLSQCTLSGSFSNNTFGKCTSLLLPEKGDYSLSCSALKDANVKELRLPSAVNYLGCDNTLPTMLERLYVSRTEPIGADNNAFKNIDFSNCTLYVPVGSKNDYEEATGWLNFTNVVEQGIKVSISGLGSLMQGNITYKNGDICFANQGSATTLKLVPDKDNEWVSVKLDGVALTVATDGAFAIPAGTTIGTLDISFTSNMLAIDNPNGGELKDKIAATGNDPSTLRAVKVVGKMAAKDWAFVKNNMPALKAFDISETDLKTIPEEALRDHQTLTVIHLPSTVVSIGNNAFENCSQLTAVNGFENVKEIGSSAFNSCVKLSEFPFGNAIQNIRNSAFYRCSSLPAALVLSASLTSIDNNVFSESSVSSFDLSQCALTNGISYNPFGQCTSLLLPEKGNYQLFWDALKDAPLKELRLPVAVSSLYGDNVLPTTLERLYLSNIEPINIDNDTKVFNNLDLDNCTLYVPIGSAEAYKEANGWSNFTNVKEYGMQANVGEQGKVHAGSQILMGTTIFFPTEDVITFEIVPNEGWHADAVTLDGTKVPFADNKFTLSNNQLNGKLAVTFAVNQYNLQLEITGNGKVKLGSLEYTASQTLTADHLSTLQFTLEPAAGLAVNSINFNGEESVLQNGGVTYVTPAITANSTLAITFGAAGGGGNVATYTVSTGEGGTVEYKNTTLLPETTIQLPKGQDAVFAMKPDQYYIVDQVKLNDETITNQIDANGNLTVKNITADAKLEVSFRINAEITVVMEGGGSLTKMLSDKQKEKVTKLIIKGPMWDDDFRAMRDEMPLLAEIDLWEAETNYIPSQAFCTSYNWDGNSMGKKSLTSVRLPKSTRSIYSWAFAGCSNLKEVNFTDLENLEYMDSYSFENTDLQDIDLRNTKLTEVGGVFRNVKGIENIKFPQAVIKLGDVFRGSTLTEMNLSNYTNLKTLDNTFSECKSLVKVTLPEGLTTINGAFNGCERLTTANLPKSLQTISNSAFSNTKFQIFDLSGLTELQSIGGWAFSNCQELTEVLFPTSLEQIGEYAFYSCNKLTAVDLSNTQLQRISERAFNWCYALENVKTPETLETIGNYAFEGCNKLGGILELKSGISLIGENAFAGTQISLIRSEATVPPTLSSNSMPETWVAAFVPEGSADDYRKAEFWKEKWILDQEVYADVTVTKEGNLAVDIIDQTGIPQATITHLKVHGPLGAQDFKIMRSNMTVLYDLDMSDAEVSVIPEQAFLDKKVLMNVTLPASLRTIEREAFKGCSSLDGSLVLPDGLEIIGQSAFQGCSSLDEVVLNENLEVIQGYAFENCSSLAQEIILPRDFQSLGERSFANCSSLYGTVKFNRDFYMFMGTEGFGSSAGSCFENCSKIETVDMSEPDFLDEIPYSTFANCTSLKTVLLPPMLDRIDNNAFENCSSLDNIEFPNTLLVINWGAFQNCISLSSVNLSECKDFGTIEGNAFNGCSNLETVYLPKSLNWINERAFADCRKLTNLTVEAVTPADLGDYVFNNVRTDRCVLSIPTGTYYDYLTAAQWGAFVSMRKNIDVTVGDGASLYFLNNGPVASARGMSRAVSDGQDGAKVKDGSSLYVQENETAIFKVNTDENAEITKVLFNGEDVTSEMVNGTYETPGVTDASSFEVQVKVTGDLHVKELRLLDDDVTMKVGEKRQLKYAVYPANATNKGIEWTSSNKNVATVNSDGIITGVAAGQAEITGKTIDGGIVEKLQIAIAPNKYWIVMDDKVAEDKVENNYDRTIKLPLALHNEEEARDIQFDVWTPKGFNMYDWNIELSERAGGYEITTENIKYDKVMRVKLHSENGKKFKGNDGELLKLTFIDDEKGGDFEVAIRNIHVSGPGNVDYEAPDHTIHFSLIPYILGDSNVDGFVNAADIVNIVNYFKESSSEKFNWKRSDANRDSSVDDADVEAIKDIIMKK